MGVNREERSRWLWPRSGLLVVLLLGTTLVDAAELDPVVADVVEMLHSGVDDEVILTWLDTTDRRPADVGKTGIITLTEAGASEGLITALLERVRGSTAGDSDPVEKAESARVPSESTSQPISASGLDASGESLEARIQLRAKRVWVDEDEPDRPREAEWWVYLYLDGELWSWTRPSWQGDPVEVDGDLAAGSHEIRVVLQRYEELRGGWLHESLAVPAPILFSARPGEPLEIEVEMVRIWGLWRQHQDGGPLRYVVRQGGSVLAESPGTAGDPSRWQPVCEDVEANFTDVDSTPRRFRNAMSRCVRWAELWSGEGRSTDRSAILSTLASFAFEPPLASH